MPRKRKPESVPTPDVEKMGQLLPMPVPVGTRHPHEHRVDPYRTLAGTVPAAEEKTPTKKGKKEDEEQRRLHGRMRQARYDHFLDFLAENKGDEVGALVEVYGVSREDAVARRADLIADVQAGVPTSSLGDDLRRRHLGDAAVARILARWAYSDNPAASLNAIKQAREIGDGGPDLGSFEQYVRIATSKT
jgi:hypothetical protein